MPAPLSIIIPTLNAAADLPQTLLSFMPGVEAGLIREVIVVDGGSQDDTTTLAEAAGADVRAVAASRGGQLRAGAKAARGDWYLFLHADTHLPADWPDVVGAAMANRNQAYAFRLAFRAAGFAPRVVAGWANMRTRLFDLPYGDQGLLIHAALYAQAGGYPDQPLMEDVALARALRGHMALLPAAVRTNAARYERDGWLRRGRRNLWTLLRYMAGADPKALAAAYKKR